MVGEPQVYISYNWGGESERIVNELDADLQAKGMVVVRDKRDLRYTGSISSFMEEIGRGRAVIVVISDGYLRSANCMRELVEVAENEDIRNRIFPVVLADAQIYDPATRLQYVKFWEDKHRDLETRMKEVGQTKLEGFREDLDLYDTIRDEISRMTSILRDMNTLSPEMHQNSDFAILFTQLEQRLGTPTGTAAPPAEATSSPPVPIPTPSARADLAGQPTVTERRRGGLSAVPTWLWIGLGILVGGILVVAIAVSGGTDDPEDPLVEVGEGEPFTYGDDASLDNLWDACESGDFASCDELWDVSPIDSEYESFGATCGHFLDEPSAAGDCAFSFGS